MAAFKATVSFQLNPSGGCWLEIEDLSNYNTNNQPLTHNGVFFQDFYKVKITRPDGTQYIYSAQAGGDALVSPPSSGLVFNSIYNFQPTDINGQYGITLITAPTFLAGESYSSADTDVVYHNGDLYAAATLTSTSTPSAPSADWILLDEPTLEASYLKYRDNQYIQVECLPETPYSTSITDSLGVNTIEVLDGCLGLSVTDASNYAQNTSPCHTLSNFTDYIKIEITRPDNSVYVLSSITAVDVDESIAAPYFSNGVYNYAFQDDIDQDGIYTVRMCNYPTWYQPPLKGLGCNYISSILTVVYWNGVLYKCIKDVPSGPTPSSPDLDPTSWEVYEPTMDEELLTRYCKEAKAVVLCLDINECNESLIHKAFCEINNDFCNDDMLCKNRDFLQATKMLMLKNAMVYSINRSDWSEVEQQMNLMRIICNCS